MYIHAPTTPLQDDSVQTTAQEVDPGSQQAGTEAQQGSPGFGLLPFVAIGALFWFLIVAPERKNRKKRAQMLDKLAKGDEVMTNGGLYGRVSRVEEDKITLTVAEGVRLRFNRAAIQSLSSELEEPEEKPEPVKT